MLLDQIFDTVKDIPSNGNIPIQIEIQLNSSDPKPLQTVLPLNVTKPHYSFCQE